MVKYVVLSDGFVGRDSSELQSPRCVSLTSGDGEPHKKGIDLFEVIRLLNEAGSQITRLNEQLVQLNRTLSGRYGCSVSSKGSFARGNASLSLEVPRDELGCQVGQIDGRVHTQPCMRPLET